MAFKVTALSEHRFAGYFNLTDEALSKLNIQRQIVDSKPGFPCRVSLQDASIGEEVLLIPFVHQQNTSPYISSGPIFIRKDAIKYAAIHEIPEMLLIRELSLRIYDAAHLMIDAMICAGRDLEPTIELIFSDSNANYIQVHNAAPGCYNCTIHRDAK